MINLKRLLNPHPLRRWLKHNKKLSWFLLGLIIIVAFFGGRGGETEEEVVESERATRVEVIDLNEYRESMRSVKASGQVEALEQVELRSEATGRVVYTNVAIGDTVYPGQVLVSINAGSLAAQLEQARADLEAMQATKVQLEAALVSQQATLADLERGPKPEELQLSQTQVEKAKQDLANHYADVKTTLKSAQSDMHEIVYQNIDGLFTNPRTNDPALIFGTENQLVKLQAQADRRRVETLLPSWLAEIDSITSLTTQDQLDVHIQTAITNINKVRTLLDALTSAALDAVGKSDDTKAGYLSLLDTQRGSVNTTLASVESQQQTIASQKVTVKQTEDQLLLTKAGTSNERIQAQEAVVNQAKAQITSQEAAIKRAVGVIHGIQAELGKTVVRSPIRGTVSTLEPRTGEFLTSGALVASVVNTEGLQVKAFIDSSDLWMVTKGASVKIDERFQGEVIHVAPSIDPATKKVEVRIVVNDSDTETIGTPPVVGQFVEVVIFSNIDEEGVTQTMQLPLQAIHTEGDKAFVFTINEDNKIESFEVELGNLVGVDVEVKTDVSELHMILASVRGVAVGDLVEIAN